MAVRKRGKRWTISAWDRSLGYMRHIATVDSYEEALEVEAEARPKQRWTPPPRLTRPKKSRWPSHPKPVVYFAIAPSLNLMKVGYTANLSQRLSQIATACPDELRVVYYLEGDRTLEADIHWMLSNYHVSGEWFRRPPDLAHFLGE